MPEFDFEEFKKQWNHTCNQVKQHPSYKHFKVIKYKSLETHDGVAYTCILTYKRKPVGTAENSGHGGPDLIWIQDSTAKQEWDTLEKIISLSPEPGSLILDCLLKDIGK